MSQNGHRRTAVFMAECRMPNMTPADLDAAQHVLRQAGRRLSAGGSSVVYLRSLYAPGKGRWICFFEAAGVAEVRRASQIAQVVFTGVEEIVELTPAM